MGLLEVYGIRTTSSKPPFFLSPHHKRSLIATAAMYIHMYYEALFAFVQTISLSEKRTSRTYCAFRALCDNAIANVVAYSTVCSTYSTHVHTYVIQCTMYVHRFVN